MTTVQKTVWLNGIEYPISGSVQRRRSSAWPAEFRAGPIEAQDYTPTRKQMWGPFKGGMGLEKWVPGADDRLWASENMETSLNLASLGPLVTTLGDATASKDFGVAPIKIVSYQSNIYAIGNNEIAYWDATASNWQTAEPSTPLPNPTDAVVFYSITPVLASPTIQPDASPEDTTFDGWVRKLTAGGTWAGIHDATAGSDSTAANSTILASIRSDASTNEWRWIYRSVLTLDLSDIPAAATISAATLSLFGQSKADDGSVSPTWNIYAATPASNTDIANGDYDQIATTAYCDTALTYANLTTNGYNDFAFNATGLAAVTSAIGGILKLGIREATYDVADSAPAWGANEDAASSFWSADKGAGYVPKISITYTTPTGTPTNCLCVASSSGRSVKTIEATGGTWTTLVDASSGSLNSTYLAQFDNRLCSMASANKGFAYSLASDIFLDWTDKSNFPNLPDSFTDLFVGKNAEGESTLYFLTPKGLYYLDVFTNFIFGPTDVKWEEDTDSGKVGLYWKGDVYIAVNKGILKISGRTITLVGPDQDDGLETLRQGVITDMIGVGNWLVAAVDNSDATTHFSSIIKRYLTGNHWHTVYKSGTANKRIRALMWKNGVLYFGEDTNMKSLLFPATTDNIKLASGHTYSTAGNFQISKFDGGFQAIPKVAHKLWAITQDCNANEKFTLDYKVNDATSWTQLGTYTSSPKPTALQWPTSGAKVGLEFENIDFRVTAARGGTSGNSPKLEKLVFEYRVVPPVIYDWTVTIEVKKYGKKRGKDFIDALETAVASKTLLTFYPTGDKGDTSYLVEVKSLPRAVKGTAYGEEGLYSLTVGQVVD